MERPVPRHDPSHLQLPVEAVQIHLDLAVRTMTSNQGISNEDWVWYEKYLTYMLEDAKDLKVRGVFGENQN